MKELSRTHIRMPRASRLADVLCRKATDEGTVSYEHYFEQPQHIAVLVMCQDCTALADEAKAAERSYDQRKSRGATRMEERDGLA